MDIHKSIWTYKFHTSDLERTSRDGVVYQFYGCFTLIFREFVTVENALHYDEQLHFILFSVCRGSIALLQSTPCQHVIAKPSINMNSLRKTFSSETFEHCLVVCILSINALMSVSLFLENLE